MKDKIIKISGEDFYEEEVLSLNKKEDYTFDVEVEDNHHYFLDNGIVSHNTISYLSDTSSGIEPIFALAFTRRIEKENNEFENVYLTDKAFDDFLETHYKVEKEDILKEVVNNNGSCQKCKQLTDKEKELFKTAGEISPADHLEMLGAVSNQVSSAVSKTINLPKDATKEQVSEIYKEAHKKGIIGVTVYRDGCRDGVLITNADNSNDSKIVKTKAPKRPISLPAELHHITLNKQKYYVAVGMFDNDIYEIFTGKNYDDDGEIFIPSKIKTGNIIKKKRGQYIFKNGDDVEYELHGFHTEDTAESLTRQISLSLRHGTEIHFIIEQLQKIKSGGFVSFSKVLARTLKKYIPENQKSTNDCPECGEKMIYSEGCVKCSKCFYTKCG